MTLALRAHRATTRHLASVYLPQASPGLPLAGPVVGLDVLSGGPFSFEPFTLYGAGVITNPNVLVLGQVGAGKSTLAKQLCWTQRSLCGRAVAILDPKGEYRSLAQHLGLAVVKLEPGGRDRLNPLDLASTGSGAESARRARSEVTANLAASGLGRPLRPEERAGVETAVDELVGTGLLSHVVDFLLTPTPTMASALRTTQTELALACREVGLELRRLVQGDLAGMFDGPSTFALAGAGSGVLIDLSAVYRNPAVLAPTMVAAGSWLTETLAAPGRQHILLLDEVWQVLSDPGVGRWLRSTMKLARAFGVAVILVTHRLADFDAVGSAGSESARLAATLVADTESRAVLAQPHAALAETAATLGLSEPETDLLSGLERGRALWHVGGHASVVRHIVPSVLRPLVDTDAGMRGSGTTS